MSPPSAADLATCVFCPRLCRHVCPAAVGSGREAATPTAMATSAWLFLQGAGSLELARQATALCLDCGACERACELHRPLGSMLGAFQRELAPTPVQPLGTIEGPGRRVAVETDDRSWAAALSARCGEPIGRLRTRDFLGFEARGDASAPRRDEALRRLFAGRTAVVADFRTMAVLEGAGVPCQHLAALTELPPTGRTHHPCRGPRLDGEPQPPLAMACCGARGPGHGMQDPSGEWVARTCVERLEVPVGAYLRTPDAACAAHLRTVGAEVLDPVSWLLDAARALA